MAVAMIETGGVEAAHGAPLIVITGMR